MVQESWRRGRHVRLPDQDEEWGEHRLVVGEHGHRAGGAVDLDQHAVGQLLGGVLDRDHTRISSSRDTITAWLISAPTLTTSAAAGMNNGVQPGR